MAMKGISALNVYKKIAIVRRSSDALTYEDADGNLKTVADLGKAASTSAPSLQPKLKNEIPTPRIINVESYGKDVPGTYEIPRSYVRYRRPTAEELDATQEYLADAEDEVWLLNNTKFGGAAHQNPPKNSEDDTEQDAATRRRPQISLGMLEQMLDILEKATGFETIITMGHAEQLMLSKIPQLLHLFPVKGRAGTVTVKHVIQDVYTFWVQKRSKLKRPLLRRFWPVTATDDTNPHLVFRPREKEKYKLRKKRQNDMDAYRKMKQLRNDFDKVRVLLELVKRREQLNRCIIEMQADWFDQRLYDAVDTSGWTRISSRLARDEVEGLLDVPKHFDTTQIPGKKGKKRKLETSRRSPVPSMGGVSEDMGDGPSDEAVTRPKIVAGRNHGEPAPHFLHPLQTRESYVTSWDRAVPFVPSFVDSHPTPTFRFRHRPRIGRGGRVVLDRLPQPSHPTIQPPVVYTAGDGVARSIKPKERLLDLLPSPLDHDSISQRIEEICISAIQDDYETAASAAETGTGVSTENDDNDGDAVLVKVDDWLETDEQLWGEERFAIGPI